MNTPERIFLIDGTEWALVPREATLAMIQAADKISHPTFGPLTIREWWDAMLSAAPPPAAAQGEDKPVAKIRRVGRTSEYSVLVLNEEAFADSVPREVYLSAAPLARQECGACGDGCKDRSGCRLTEDSPSIARQEALAGAEPEFEFDDTGDDETCEGSAPECGPVVQHDSEGVPLCQTCWDGLVADSEQEAALHAPNGARGEGLHPATRDLVQRFAAALADKLAAAERKYGYSDGWTSPDWMGECRVKLLEHVAKGDPRDVAAYCAFLWHHGASTSAPVLACAHCTNGEPVDVMGFHRTPQGFAECPNDGPQAGAEEGSEQ